MRVWRYRTAKEPHLNPVLITPDEDRETVYRYLQSRYILDGGIVELTNERDNDHARPGGGESTGDQREGPASESGG